MTRMTIRIAAAALSAGLAAAACRQDELFRPYPNGPVDALFTRYVSMGNSITAGFQSVGINDSTQLQSYAVLLARQARTPFFVPLMARPGCPPPIDTLFRASGTPHRVGGGTAGTCALRAPQAVPPPYINNVAVPGAAALDLITNLGPGTGSNALTTFFLGGLTQIQAMKRVDPTFVTVWIGNNDVLAAATAGGDTTKITDTTTFKAEYGAILDSLGTTNVRAGVLIGVANVTLIPFFSKGSTYWAIKNGLVPGAAFPPNFAVDNVCAPALAGGIGDSVLVSFQFGVPLIAAALANPALQDTLHCTEVPTVQPAEFRKLARTVVAYNNFISSQAGARGYAYLDPNALFTALPAGSIPAFPALSGAASVTTPFGAFFSRDGVHPSAASHKLLANALIGVINGTYGSSIPAVP
jgi:hypothetical protein